MAKIVKFDAEARAAMIRGVNMWWLQTANPMKPMIAPEKIINPYPKSGFREKTGMISDTIPIAGRMRM